MFDNVGGKVKTIAVIWFVICALGAVITGIAMWADWGDIEGFLLFLAIGVGGLLVSYVSSLLLYAFGEMVENIASIEDDTGYIRTHGTKTSAPNTETKAPETATPVFNAPQKTFGVAIVKCPSCGKEQLKSRGNCELCGMTLS